MRGAAVALAAQRDIDVIHSEGFWKFAGVEGSILGNVDVEDFAALLAVEMPMFAHVGAKANRGAIKDDLANEAAFDEDAEAIVNGREGNFGICFFGALEDLFGARMIVAFGDDIENLLALARHPQPAGGETLGQVFVFVDVHRLNRFVEEYGGVRRVVK